MEIVVITACTAATPLHQPAKARGWGAAYGRTARSTTGRRKCGFIGRARIEPGSHRTRNGIHAAGLNVDLADGRETAVRLGRRSRDQYRLRTTDHRISAIT